MFKNETYFWFCALQRDPMLQDRGIAAIRSLFLLGKGTPKHLSPIEKLGLTAYGLSMMMAVVAIIGRRARLRNACCGGAAARFQMKGKEALLLGKEAKLF